MSGFIWMIEHGFEIVGAFGAFGGLVFTAVSIRAETHTRRVSNLIALTEGHRDLWKFFIDHPELRRVLSQGIDLQAAAVTAPEERFVLLLILHLQTTFRAMQDRLLPRPEGVRGDVRTLFSMSVPAEVWKRYRAFQDADFVRFVDDCLHGK
jgi:hypothetical protein